MKKITYVIIVIAVIAVYAVIRIVPGYIHDFQIQSITNLVAKKYADPAARKDIEVFLYRKFQDMELPIVQEDFKIEANESTVRVYVDWTYEARFIPQNEFVPAYSRFYRFHEEAIEKIKQ